MSNLGGTTFKFVYANRDRIENGLTKRNSLVVYNKDDDSPPEYDFITDAVAYNVNSE